MVRLFASKKTLKYSAVYHHISTFQLFVSSGHEAQEKTHKGRKSAKTFSLLCSCVYYLFVLCIKLFFVTISHISVDERANIAT